MKACNHCGGRLRLSYGNGTSIAWCAKCVKEDNHLLKSCGLHPKAIPDPENGEWSWGMDHNIDIVKTIPLKGTLPKDPLPTIVEVLQQIKQEKQLPVEEKIDFDRYNSVLPGRRHG